MASLHINTEDVHIGVVLAIPVYIENPISSTVGEAGDCADCTLRTSHAGGKTNHIS